MRNKLLKKLHSERGASITFALLLFLVCAAVGSVVLASATATAGRVSENYAFDQRYYAVMSAAELLRDSLNGKTRTVKIEQTATRADTVTTFFNSGNDPVGAPSTAPGDTITAYPDGIVLSGEGGAAVSSDANLLDRALRALVGNSTGADKAAAVFSAGRLTADGSQRTLILTVTPEGGSALTGLEVTITETLLTDGSLVYRIENSSGTDKYRLELTLTADVHRSTSSSETVTRANPAPLDTLPDGAPGGAVSATSQTITYKTTRTQTYTITWKASAINPV